MYVAGNLPVYYPEEAMFAPDLIAVVDVSPHPRNGWMVSAEGKGLDFALEVLWSGKRRKDLVTNVERLARLGVPDYFVFDMARGRLHGFRLEGAAYVPLVPHAGRFEARALGLQLGLEGGKVRFYASTAPIPDEAELLERLATTRDDSVALVADLEQRLAESERAREEERAAREAAQSAREEERAAREAAQSARDEERAAREAAEKARDDAEARLAAALEQLAALTNKSD